MLKKTNLKRKKRALRLRKKIHGTAERPRLSINKSNRNLYVQVIDDDQSKTLVGLGTMKMKKPKSKQSAKELGKKIVELCKKQSISKVVFDRGRYKYHGLLVEFATAARSSGLQF